MSTVDRQLMEQHLGRMALEYLEELAPGSFRPYLQGEAALILNEIYACLEDSSLDDFQCVEEILVRLGRHGINSSRHDFG